MRKFLLPLIALLFCSATFVSTHAQQARQQAREAEWKNYVLPKTNFARKNDAEKTVVLRVPADWQQRGATLSFTGPHAAAFEVFTQKVPEGYPLDDFFAATLQVVRDAATGAETVLTRRTQIQDVDARELVFDAPSAEGEMIRSVSWLAISGPHVFGFNLQVPLEHAAEIERYYKAIVQSVNFVSDSLILDELQNAPNTTAKAAPVDEIENIAESLSGTTSQRDAAVAQLKTLFAAKDDAALDLLLDHRPLIRMAAVQAAAQSNNSSLTPVLWKLLDDREPFVSAAAARGVANSADVVTKLLNNSMFGFQSEKVARVWQFMPQEKRNELLEIIFKRTAEKRDEPPPAVSPPPAKSGVSVSVKELTALKPGTTGVTMESVASTDPKVQISALTLLGTVPPGDFKLPFARVLASHYDPLIAVALQVALWRGEVLPVADLLKLVTSANKQVSTFAAESLAMSATLADVPAIEALLSKDGSKKESDEQLKLVVKKINFRNTLGDLKTQAERSALINKTLGDATVADFAWRHHCEATAAGCAPVVISAKTNLSIKPLGENLFPQRLKNYTAIPNPRQAVQRFYETLHGLQMDSPQTQASLVLMLTNIRKLLGQSLNAPAAAEELIDYSGIDPDGAIAFGTWTAANARDTIASAERKAIVLRVKDRARFERNLNNVHNLAGGAMKLTEIAGGVSRAVAALPALIPFTAQAALSDRSSSTKSKRSFPLIHYSFSADQQWNGFTLRTLDNREISSDWAISDSVTYIAYLGDTAILAPDIASLRDVLTNAISNDDRKLLADNVQFREAVESHGDVIYFSDLTATFAQPGDVKAQVNELGALKFSSSTWENSDHIKFDESEWAKPLLPFHPKELTAPRELLPASTIAYFLMKIDPNSLGSNAIWSALLKPELQPLTLLWTSDFKQEVLPELGPECGAALMELPELTDVSKAAWAVFCKLKSNKLAEALTAGKLLHGVGPTTDVAEVKFAGDSYFVSVRSGFLVVSNNPKVPASFDRKTNLAASRDYSRSIDKVPNGVIAFGGYNLEAAVTAVSSNATEGMRGQVANVLFSFANAFHSQNLFAIATGGSVEVHSSVSMDREGRYSVADFSTLPRNTSITYAVVEPGGVPITDQERLSSLVLRLRAKAPGPIDNIKDDIKSATQRVEQKSPTELLVTVAARTSGDEKAVQLPVKDAEFSPYLKATPEFAADKKEVIDQARQIAGDDRDAWSVARKLAAWTNKNLEWKLVTSASPVETLATREADCSEFSALFIAMARSLGLPARMVSGLAYSGSSFGGHAWVEVWAGRWIELDPTWGTSFVDATHVRNATNTLVTSAALNLIDIEVVDAERTVAEFQKTPRALAEHLARVIPSANKPEIEAALDLGVLVDESLGAGAWAKLSDGEREQLWSAYRRIVVELLTYGREHFGTKPLRLIHLEEKGETAEALCITRPTDMLLKLRFARHDGRWQLVEVLLSDSDLLIVGETLRPALLAIAKARAGEKVPPIRMTDFVRLLYVIEKDPAKAAVLADELLKADPKNTGFRFIKGLALLDVEKVEEAEKVLTELGNEGFAPALYRLANDLSDMQEEPDDKKTIEFYQRYLSLEPYDVRAVQELAFAYEEAEQYEQAVATHRKAIELEPTNTENYRDLISLILTQNLKGDARALLEAGEKYQEEGEDVFGEIMENFFYISETKAAEKFALAEPSRMKTSALANLSLGELLTEDGRYVAAERSLNTAVRLYTQKTGATNDSDTRKSLASTYVALSQLCRKQSRWLVALKEADQALTFDANSHEAYFERACALARLHRSTDAIAALTKAIELSEYVANRLADEADLKPLSTLPAFQKLLPKPKDPK
jgi:tetratricopeptide (TPR) repeat protein